MTKPKPALLDDESAAPPIAELLSAWWSHVRRWALWETGDPALADDVVQDAWLRVDRSIRRLDPEGNVGGWLRVLVRNVARDHLAAAAWRRPDPHEPDRDPGPDLERDVDLRRGADRMLAAFATLTPRQREALDWVDRCGLTPQEAAEKMCTSHATVRVLLHQGRHALRAHLTELHDLVRR